MKSFSPIIFPVHPRTHRRIVEFGLNTLQSEFRKSEIH
jgi:hypothetical protein